MRKYLSINQPQMKNQFYKSIQLAVVTWKLKNEKLIRRCEEAGWADFGMQALVSPAHKPSADAAAARASLCSSTDETLAQLALSIRSGAGLGRP
jgi:hypothetical protein